MKDKKVLVFAFAIVLLMLVGVASASVGDFFKSIFNKGGVTGNPILSKNRWYCNDSDLGSNIFQKGVLSYNNYYKEIYENYTDYCRNNQTLMEYYCKTGSSYAVNVTACQNGCRDGACLTGTVVGGETIPLFTGGSKIYLNDSLNKVRTSITKAELPSLLADRTFMGDYSYVYVSSFIIGYGAQLVFAKQPTSSQDPTIGFSLSVSSRMRPKYTSVVDFNRPANFTSSNAKGKEIVLFGKRFVVDESTSVSSLVLRDAAIARRLIFVEGTSIQEVFINGESSFIDGTSVHFSGGINSMTKLEVSVSAPNSDNDALLIGQKFVDPVFKTFSIDFVALANNEDSKRETIGVYNNGDDKLMISMTDNRGYSKAFQWVQGYYMAEPVLAWDGEWIHVVEREVMNKSDYVVVGNENEGRLMKVVTITNATTGYSSDKVTLQDVFSGESVDATITAEGKGTITIAGKVYGVDYWGASDLPDDSKAMRLDYPDSLGNNEMIIYPTLQTLKGAKVSFYEPLYLNLFNQDYWFGVGSNLTKIKIPNGAGSYQIVNITFNSTSSMAIDGELLDTGKTKRVDLINTNLRYNFTYSSPFLVIKLDFMPNYYSEYNSALVILEEKEDSNKRQALVVIPEAGYNAIDGIGVGDVYITNYMTNSLTNWGWIDMPSDNTKSKRVDRYGTIATMNSNDSDQRTATISYPDEQVHAMVYLTSSLSQTSTCTDSDNGLDYYVYGTARGINGYGSDVCIDNNLLGEFACASNGAMYGTTYSCSNGCLNGACRR